MLDISTILGTCFAAGPHIELDFTSVFFFSPSLSLVVANGDVSRVQQTVDREFQTVHRRKGRRERGKGRGGGGRRRSLE